MVALGPRAARAALPLDDGSAHHPLAAALPEALRRAGARAAGRRGGRHAVVGRLPPLASRAFAPRHARGAAAPSRGTTLLSPFDSCLWYQDRMARLCGIT